jgi:flavin-binding protein dodecin
MPDRTYKRETIVGVSERSIDDALRNALARASQTLQGRDWFEVVERRGTLREGGVGQFQVTLAIGFRVLSPEELQR